MTTIGSEMTRSRQEQQYESEEEDENAEPFQYQDSETEYKDNHQADITPDAYLNKAIR